MRKRRGAVVMWCCRTTACIIWQEGGGGRLVLGSDEDDSRAASTRCSTMMGRRCNRGGGEALPAWHSSAAQREKMGSRRRWGWRWLVGSDQSFMLRSVPRSEKHRLAQPTRSEWQPTLQPTGGPWNLLFQIQTNTGFVFWLGKNISERWKNPEKNCRRGLKCLEQLLLLKLCLKLHGFWITA
jgi:hypothetical protein